MNYYLTDSQIKEIAWKAWKYNDPFPELTSRIKFNEWWNRNKESFLTSKKRFSGCSNEPAINLIAARLKANKRIS